jgi:hypothetical protein
MDSKLNIKIIAALTLVHFTGDFYTSFTSPLLPVYVDKLGPVPGIHPPFFYRAAGQNQRPSQRSIRA